MDLEHTDGLQVGSLSSAARASAQSGVYEGAEMVARPGAALRRELERAGEVLWLGAIVDSALSMLVVSPLLLLV